MTQEVRSLGSQALWLWLKESNLAKFGAVWSFFKSVNFLKNTHNVHFDSLVQDCSNSSALAMELIQSCAKSLIVLWDLIVYLCECAPSLVLFAVNDFKG